MLAKQTDTATGLRRHTHAAQSCKQSAVLRPDSTSYIIASIHTAESSEGCHLPVVLSPKQRRGVSVVSGVTPLTVSIACLLTVTNMHGADKTGVGSGRERQTCTADKKQISSQSLRLIT